METATTAAPVATSGAACSRASCQQASADDAHLGVAPDDRGDVRGLDDRQRGVGRELDRPHITGGQLGAGRDVAHDLEDPDPFIGRREHEQHHPDGYQ
jgi:hypothetical protein